MARAARGLLLHDAMRHTHTAHDQSTRSLDELRVALPGVQILFALLVMLPFTQRFAALDRVGLGLFGGALLATAFASIAWLAPSVHQRLYVAHDGDAERRQLERTRNRLALAGSLFLAIGIVCALALLGELLLGRVGGIVAASGASSLCCLLWYALPLAQRGRSNRDALRFLSHEIPPARRRAAR